MNLVQSITSSQSDGYQILQTVSQQSNQFRTRIPKWKHKELGGWSKTSTMALIFSGSSLFLEYKYNWLESQYESYNGLVWGTLIWICILDVSFPLSFHKGIIMLYRPAIGIETFDIPDKRPGFYTRFRQGSILLLLATIVGIVYIGYDACQQAN